MAYIRTEAVDTKPTPIIIVVKIGPTDFKSGGNRNKAKKNIPTQSIVLITFCLKPPYELIEPEL